MSDPLRPTDDQLDALTVEVQAIGVGHISDREAALYLWRLIAPMILGEAAKVEGERAELLEVLKSVADHRAVQGR